MDITLVKPYGCVVCSKNVITHLTTEHLYEGEVPDQSNCDFSTYSDPKVFGGKLLMSRPRAETIRLPIGTTHKKDWGVLAPGGICENCLKNETVKKLVAAKAIAFDENPGTFRTYT